MIKKAVLAAVLAVAACSNPAQQTAVTGAVVTLASVAAANNTTVASLVTKGALFCQSPQLASGQTIAGIVAVSLTSGQTASVLNQGSQAVADACSAISMIPVPAPANPSAVPVVTVPAANLPPTA